MHRKTTKRIGNTAAAGNLKHVPDAVKSSLKCRPQTSEDQHPLAVSQSDAPDMAQSDGISPSVSLCLLRAAATDTLDVAFAINDEGMAAMAHDVISFCEARLRG